MPRAVFVTEVEVTDPESQAPVMVSIYKDEVSGAMFGVDSSFVERMSDEDKVIEPFNETSVSLVGD